MAYAGGIRAGAAFIELSVRDAKFIRGLQGALARLKTFGMALQNVGAGIRTAGLRLATLGAGLVTPLLLSARAFSKMGDQLEKMSRRTGASVEALSELGYAAELSGTNLETVEVGIRRMQKTIAGAAGGGKEPSKALETLGINLGEIIQLAPDEQLDLIGKRLTALTDPTIRAAAAMAIFGRSGTELLPMMEEMGALRAEARRLGFVMSTEDARSAAILNDAMDRLWTAFRRIVAAVGGALAPMLSGLSDRIVELAGKARAWLEQNKGLIVSILKIGTVTIGAGVALTALGGIVSVVGTLFATFATIATAALSFLLSPIGLVIAAVAGLAATIAWATGAAGEALQWLGGRFQALQNFALESFQGIKDALAAGDVALAAKVLWLSLQVVWRSGINTLKGWWLD
ncbi:MAG: phage tail tape measure protein, partial [Acidobacteriota bacterium]